MIHEGGYVRGITSGGKSDPMPRLIAEAERAGLTPTLVEDEVHGLLADDAVRERLDRLIRESRSTAMPELDQR